VAQEIVPTALNTGALNIAFAMYPFTEADNFVGANLLLQLLRFAAPPSPCKAGLFIYQYVCEMAYSETLKFVFMN
jgi:hypothetical protein